MCWIHFKNGEEWIQLTDFSRHRILPAAGGPRGLIKGIRLAFRVALSRALERKRMQMHTSRLPAQNYKSSNVPNVLSPHACKDRFLVWPHLLTPTNELRIAVQAIGDEIHDVFLGSLIHKRPHRVASRERTCIPISDELQLRALKDQVPLLVLILFIYFSARFFAVPDAWRLWAGPRLAYCCG